MFAHVSWTDFFHTVFWLLLVYYSVVLLRYYRQEIIRLLIRKPKAVPAVEQPVIKHPVLSIAKSSEEPSVYAPGRYEKPPALIQTLKDEVAAFIPEAVGNGFEKEALLSSLAFILSKYSSPDIVLHRDHIQQWIVEQCRTHSSVQFSESELAGLWNC